jgi:hypothetical protein
MSIGLYILLGEEKMNTCLLRLLVISGGKKNGAGVISPPFSVMGVIIDRFEGDALDFGLVVS